MGGRGTFAAGKNVAYTYETVGKIEGVKVLETKKEKFDSLMHGRAKNPYNWKTVARQNGYETTTFMIPDRTGTVLGDITLFINESPSRDSLTTDYNLFVQHTVWKNK